MDLSLNTAFTDEYKEKVYEDLSQVMIDSLDTGEITIAQSKEISQFILDRLEIIVDIGGLNSFLQELANKWPIYLSVSLILQDEGSREEKTRQIQENLKLINNQ